MLVLPPKTQNSCPYVCMILREKQQTFPKIEVYMQFLSVEIL